MGSGASKATKPDPLKSESISASGPSTKLLRSTSINHEKRRRLQNMKVFVLDNSLRESTVGQVVGHSLNDKFKILDAVTSVGFTHQIAGSFSSARRVDDKFCMELAKRGADGHNYYAFSEDSDEVVDGVMLFGDDHIPIGLQKCQKYNMAGCIFEVDLADESIDWDGKFPISKFMEMMIFLLKWTHANFKCGKPRNMVNLRDLPFAMVKYEKRTLAIVEEIAKLPIDIRPTALLFEEPVGEYFPEEIAEWTKLLRSAMDRNSWTSKFQQNGTQDGLLLFHAHKQWGFADVAVLDSLASGADGVWASLSEEGAAMGHACSAVMLANLARLGNKDVLTRFHTRNLAKAARAVTETVTNKPVNPRQIVYGPRAIEAVFGFAGITGESKRDPMFDFDGNSVIDDIDHTTLAQFLGVEDPPVRINTLSSSNLVKRRLIQCFGKDDKFTEEAAGKLLVQIEKELENNLEREHTSAVGLALLWDATFGSCTGKMKEILDTNGEKIELHNKILEEAEACFKNYLHDKGNNGSLSFNGFYEGYLQPFIGCFTCPRTRFILDAIDMDDDGNVTWDEWGNFWCRWALREYPDEIANVDDLHNVVLRQAIIPNSLASAKSVILK